MEDRVLVEAALAGNPFGFPAIFDCHAAPVHDLALALLRDQRRALDVVESTFLEAGLKLHDSPQELRLPVWLLALAGRKCALRSGGAVRGAWLPSFPEDDAGRARLASLVWEAVAELPLRERTLLDLERRQGLEGEALTGALGLALGASSGQVEDLRAGLAGRAASLSAHLVARTGGCADLAGRLDGWDGRFAPSDPHQLADHVQRCPDCAQAAAGLASPFCLYAVALAAPYPVDARDRVLDRVVVPTGPAPAEEVPAEEATGPPPLPPAPAPSDPRSVASTQFQRSAPAVIRSRPRSRSVGSPAAPGPSGPAQPDRPSTRPAPLLVLKVRPDHPPDQQPGPASAGSPAAAAPVLVAPPLDAPAAAGGSGRATPRPPAGAAPPPPPQAAEPWLPGGFPPPSFAGQGPRAGRRSSPGGVRWLAAVAILGAVLLAAGALLIANRDDGQTSLASDVTATSELTVPATVPTTGTAGTAAAPAPPGPAPSVPGGAGPAAAVTTTTARPAPTVAASGSLVPAFDSLRLPRIDTTEAPQSGRLPLRNTGSAPATYTVRSSFPGLTVDRPSATIGPGAAIELTVTLDGSKAPEGELASTLTFEGSGGTRQVGVAATVGRPPVIKDDAGEPCTNEVTPCSRLIRLEDPVSVGKAPATPCNSRWRYSVTVEDESRLSRVRAEADRPGASGDLTRDGSVTGPGGRWQSQVFEPVPVGAALTFTIRAVDAFDFFSSRTVRRIVC